MKLAFFGGSFDPPHLGHDTIVKSALANLDIDKLIIMPTYINPFKYSYSAPPKLRYSWAKKLWSDLDRVEVSTYEIDQNRPVPTIESVRELYKRYEIEKFYLLIGADHLSSLHLWDSFEELNKLVTFIIASRNHIKIPKYLAKFDIDVNISSSYIRESLEVSKIPAKLQKEIVKFYQGLKMKEKIAKIVEILENKKAENVEVIDMSGKEYMAKNVIIATTLATRQSASLIDDIKEGLKPFNEKFLNVESSDEWSVIDLGDIIIHLMSENYRSKYNIEELLATLKLEHK